jgi:hypothetical protein
MEANRRKLWQNLEEILVDAFRRELELKTPDDLAKGR